MKCKCSDSCEHYVPNSSKTGLYRNCAARISRWRNREVDEALNYAQKLDVRRGTLSFVISKTQVAEFAIARRKEVAENERKEREKEARKARRRRKRV